MPAKKLSERFTRPPGSLTVDKYLRDEDHPLASSSASRQPRLVPLVVMDYGSLTSRLQQMTYTPLRRLLVGSIREMLQGTKSIKNNPYLGKTQIPPGDLQDLEAFARESGVGDIGYTKVNPDYIFDGYQILFPQAIVFTFEMDSEKIRTAPSMASFVEIFRTYYQLGVTVNRVADWLRKRGYNAHAGPAVGGDLNYIPLARDAGLGEVGKNGLLITPRYGPRVRLAAVYTDIENLPFTVEYSQQWISKFCETCQICVDKCPTGAIYSRAEEHPRGGPVFIDHRKCAEPFSVDNGCSLCIKHCPFSCSDYQTIKTRFHSRSGRSTAGHDSSVR